jgi:steroid delta-isomerase-like uncharacterized protein
VTSDRLPQRAPVDELADRWRAAWQHEGFAAVCTPDVRYEDPVAVEPIDGIEELHALAITLRRAFPDLRVERAGAPLAREGYACLPWRTAGTHKGDLPSLPATNRFVIVHGLHYVELADGLVRRARGFFDLYDVATQLGLLPRRGSLGETALLLLRGFGLRPRA